MLTPYIIVISIISIMINLMFTLKINALMFIDTSKTNGTLFKYNMMKSELDRLIYKLEPINKN